MVFLEAVLVLVSLVMLWLSSDYIVEAARKIARHFGVSELFIGLTVAAVGTSLPEISNAIVSGIGRAQGADTSSYALGNIISANFGQITLILGIVGLVALMRFDKKDLLKSGIVMILAIVALFLTAVDGVIMPWEAAVLIALYLGYLIALYFAERPKTFAETREKTSLPLQFAIVAAGALVLWYFAKLLVSNAVSLAQLTSISPYLIGFLTGLGTSLPELTVSLRAVLRKAGGLSVGNLIGSNITDPLFSISLGAVIAPLAVEKGVLLFDFPYWFAASLIALFLLVNKEFHRKKAAVLILIYLLFIYLKVWVV